jgi:hypothetical protein
MTINFQDPRLQRARQKMAALSPESAAIFDTASATSKFASNDMMKQLKLMRFGNQLKARRENFALRQRERIGKLNLAQDQFGFEKKQGKTAAILSGLSIIPKAYLGYKAYQESGQNAEDVLKLARRIQQSTGNLGG